MIFFSSSTWRNSFTIVLIIFSSAISSCTDSYFLYFWSHPERTPVRTGILLWITCLGTVLPCCIFPSVSLLILLSLNISILITTRKDKAGLHLSQPDWWRRMSGFYPSSVFFLLLPHHLYACLPNPLTHPLLTPALPRLILPLSVSGSWGPEGFVQRDRIEKLQRIPRISGDVRGEPVCPCEVINEGVEA